MILRCLEVPENAQKKSKWPKKMPKGIIHSDLFVYAENYLKKIENESLDKFDFLVKLHDRAEIIYSKND